MPPPNMDRHNLVDPAETEAGTDWDSPTGVRWELA
jgi:hypothetical protein